MQANAAASLDELLTSIEFTDELKPAKGQRSAYVVGILNQHMKSI
jgi:hypothetical protein